MDTLRNLPLETPQPLADLIAIQPGSVVSMALSRSDHCQMTLLAFAEGEGVSEERYFGDTLYLVLEGAMTLQQQGTRHTLQSGDSCSSQQTPATPSAVQALLKFCRSPYNNPHTEESSWNNSLKTSLMPSPSPWQSKCRPNLAK